MSSCAPYLLLLLGRLQLVGAPACPTREALERHLQQALGATFEATDQRLALESDGQTLLLRLLEPDGHVLGEKRLPVSLGSCDSLAADAALLVSMWEPALPIPVLESPAKTVGRAKAPEPPWIWELGGGVGGAWVGKVAASEPNVFPGATLFASFGRGHFSGRLSVSGDLPAQAPVGTAQIGWDRPTLGISGAYRFEPSFGSVDLEATLLGEFLVLGVNHFSTAALNFGLAPRFAGRFYLGHGRLRPWLELSVPCFPNADTVQIQWFTFTLQQPILSASAGAAYRFD